MSDLTKFRDYCAEMAQGGHTSECVAVQDTARARWGYWRMFREWRDEWGPKPDGPPTSCSGGCLSADDRDLFARLASEVDDYLDPHPTLWEGQ